MKIKKRAWIAAALLACGIMAAPAAPAQAGLFDNLGCLSNSCDTLGCDPVGCCDDLDCSLADFDPCGCDATGCDSGCDSGGCAASGCLDSFASKLTGCSLIKPSDQCFDDFISPMIDFVHFEDPRTLTELRPIFVQHNFPSVLGPGNVPAGGSAQLIALQFRIALTERLSLIGVKDGYIIDNSEGALNGLLNSGWADITAGLKYNLIRNVKTGTLASAGFTYEIPMGSEGALQAQGDGVFHFFGSAAQRLLDGNAHYMTSVGWQLPVDQTVQGTSIHWLNHFDVRLTDKLYAFTENSWWHWTDEADEGLALGVSGQDLLNLSSIDIAGNTLVTHNVGLKYKPSRSIEYGVAYEFPLTGFRDIIEDRYQVEAIFRY